MLLRKPLTALVIAAVQLFGPPAHPHHSHSIQHYARLMITRIDHVKGDAEWSCLDKLWIRESGWNKYATNPYSGAYGIPQALPASKMASAGSDWRTDARTQVRWGLTYIRSIYRTPCGAWNHETTFGWY